MNAPEGGVIHVRNDSADGRAVERAQAAMARWHARGWSVQPMPADTLPHPYDTPCLICGPSADQLAALRAVAAVTARSDIRHDWATSDQVDEPLPAGANSTPLMAPLHAAGLVRRIHWGRRYAYQLAIPGLAALTRAAAQSSSAPAGRADA